IGFIRGLLSKKHNQDVEYAEAIKWIEKFFGGKYIVPESNLDTKLTQFFNKPKFDDTGSFKISVKEFLSRLEKPEYFIKRGYKPETLSHFKVGYCNNQSKR